jgi:hypothetical protein
MSAGKFTYRNTAGNFVEGEISLQDYELAATKGVRTAQVINAKYPDADPQLGTAWEQGKRSVGIFVHGDQEFGIPSTNFREALNGECMRQAGLLQLAGNSIVAPSLPVGSSTPASRLFLPEVILEMIEENLQPDYGVEQSLFERMIADNLSIAGPVYTMPTINTEAPMAHDGRSIAQNTMPRNLVSITASQTSKTLASESIGLQISDQALQLSTLNLVSIILGRQMEGQKLRMLWSDLAKVVSGNVDSGESALTPVDFKATYDTSAGADEITHKGWIKALYKPDRTVRYDSLVCTIDDYLAIQNRTGRPLMFDPKTSGTNTGNAGDYGIDVTMSAPANFAQLSVPFVFIVPDGLWAAGQVLLFDSRYALRRVTNTLAAYSAVESMVLQRSTFYRADWGFIIHRLIDDAFLLLDYTND